MNKVSKLFLVIILLLLIVVGVLFYYVLYWRDSYLSAAEQIMKTAENQHIIENRYQRKMENVSIKVIDDTITPQGATILITDNNEYSYMWLENYKLQIDQGDVWTDVTPISTPFFNEIIYTVNDANQIEQKIDWSSSYGTLPAGTYRIIKEVSTSTALIHFDSNSFEIK